MFEPVYDILDCGPRHRFSANGKLVHNSNWQNFKRDSNIRRAILAPEGFLLGTVDLSQIEYRILCCLANEEDALDELRRGEDPYIDIASDVYGEKIYKAPKTDPRFLEMETKRGTGKQLKLSCGFQAGAATIQRTAKLGIYGPPVYIELDEAERWKTIYRNKMVKTVAYWGEAGRMIARIASSDPLQWGPMSIRDGKIVLPNGCPLHFPFLEYHVDNESGDKFWRYKNRHGWSKLYSGKLCENVVQALARVVMSQAMVRIARMGYRVVNTTHDELLLLIPKDGREQQHLEICKSEMVREPPWLPGIPLGVEGELSERYSK